MTYIMTEREDKVYKAKLAEQAERYDGKYYFLRTCFLMKSLFILLSVSIKLFSDTLDHSEYNKGLRLCMII